MAWCCQKIISLQWRHNGHDRVSNHQLHDCSLNRLFRRRSKKTSKFRVTGLCVENLPGTGEFPAQMASNAENIPVWWRYHVEILMVSQCYNNKCSFWKNEREWVNFGALWWPVADLASSCYLIQCIDPFLHYKYLKLKTHFPLVSNSHFNGLNKW